MLANLLRTAFRFRWEVLEKFSHKILNAEEIGRLDNALNRIEQDWESKRLAGAEEIVNLFSDVEGGDQIMEMMRSWNKARNLVKTGALDIAIVEKDSETIFKILGHFNLINQKFLEIAAEHFLKSITKN